MLKIIAITLSLVGTIYILTAIFGYRTFYNYTASEFLTAFEYLHFENFGINLQIILAKVRSYYLFETNSQTYLYNVKFIPLFSRKLPYSFSQDRSWYKWSILCFIWNRYWLHISVYDGASCYIFCSIILFCLPKISFLERFSRQRSGWCFKPSSLWIHNSHHACCLHYCCLSHWLENILCFGWTNIGD